MKGRERREERAASPAQAWGKTSGRFGRHGPPPTRRTPKRGARAAGGDGPGQSGCHSSRTGRDGTRRSAQDLSGRGRSFVFCWRLCAGKWRTKKVRFKPLFRVGPFLDRFPACTFSSAILSLTEGRKVDVEDLRREPRWGAPSARGCGPSGDAGRRLS